MNIIEYAKFKKMFGGSGGTSSNEPKSYTVSSVDELPSNAVDGSMAIVESDSIEGKWIFKENIDVLPTRQYYVGIKHIDGSGRIKYYVGFIFNEDIVGLLSTYGNDYADFYESGEWLNNRELTFLNDNTDLREWVNQNADRLSGGYSLYIRENGEWVYKCEVI